MPRTSTLKSIFSTLTRRQSAEGGAVGGEKKQKQQAEIAAKAAASSQAVFLTAVAADASVGAVQRGQVRSWAMLLAATGAAATGGRNDSSRRKQAPRASFFVFFAAAAAAYLSLFCPFPSSSLRALLFCLPPRLADARRHVASLRH